MEKFVRNGICALWTIQRTSSEYFVHGDFFFDPHNFVGNMKGPVTSSCLLQTASNGKDVNSGHEDHWKPPSPTSCNDSTVHGDIAEEERQLYCTPEGSWDNDGDEWTSESPRQSVTIFQIPLKHGRSFEDDHPWVQMRTLKRQKTLVSPVLMIAASEESTLKRTSKMIRFNETVDVVPIPMRSEYTVEMRHNVWSSTREIQENAARNTLEFAHDGWDWRKVADEDVFQQCPEGTGRWIHPVHCSTQ